MSADLSLDAADYYLNAASKVSHPTTKAALVFLSANSIRSIGQKLGYGSHNRSSAIVETESSANNTLEYSFRRNRLHVDSHKAKLSNQVVDVPIPKSTVVSDTAVVKDILALELKLAELGSLSLPFSDESQSLNGSIMNKSLLSSFISNKPSSPLPTGGVQSPFIRNKSGNGNKLLSNMPSALGESYMFLNENSAALKKNDIEPSCNMKKNKAIPFSNAINNHRILNRDAKPNQNAQSKELNTSSCGISAAAVDNLLSGMNRLEKENFKLLKRIDGLLELERNQHLKQIEIDTFKQDFAEKYEKLKAVLGKFAEKYPSQDNPVTRATAVPIATTLASSGIATSDANEIDSKESLEKSKITIKQLERTLRGALSRLNKIRSVLSEKEKLIMEYERQLGRSLSVSRSGAESVSGSGTVSASGSQQRFPTNRSGAESVSGSGTVSASGSQQPFPTNRSGAGSVSVSGTGSKSQSSSNQNRSSGSSVGSSSNTPTSVTSTHTGTSTNALRRHPSTVTFEANLFQQQHQQRSYK